MQAPRESLCPLLLGDSNYCTRGHLSRGCGAVKPKPFFSHPSLGQQEPAAAIGPMTAHSEGLLSRAGVMATEGSGGLGRGDLLAASAGAHRPHRGGGGGGHSEGFCGLLVEQEAGLELSQCLCWGPSDPVAFRALQAAGLQPPKQLRVPREVLTPSVAARAGI